MNATQPDGSEPTHTDVSPPTEATGNGRRDLRVSIHLLPSADGYRAILSASSEGCDPRFRSLDAENLQDALGEVPGFVADAEGEWTTPPRYPKVKPNRSAKAPKQAAGSQPKEGKEQQAERQPAKQESPKPENQQLTLQW